MLLTTDVPRPVLRYHGGKWKLAPWIVEHFGAHTFYTEAFGGAASVLLRKPRAIGEVYNDLNDDLVNLFTVLREERLAQQLRQQLELTGYARKEFERARQPSSDPVESARRLIVRSYMGFGSAGFNADYNTGFRSTIKRGVSQRQVQRGPAYEWASYPEIIMPLMQRMQGVVIEERPAEYVLAKHDSRQTLHYVDPPYELTTRGNNNGVRQKYKFELTNNQHIDLATQLHALDGMVVLSGYGCDLYDEELYRGWWRTERLAHADGARKRTEVLWLNEAAVQAMERARQKPAPQPQQQRLFLPPPPHLNA